MHQSRIRSTVQCLMESDWGSKGDKDDSEEEYGSDLAKGPAPAVVPPVPEGSLTADQLRHMATGIDVACGHCAQHGLEPSDHLQTALWQFARAVRHHHEGRHGLSQVAFGVAHEALQKKLSK